MMSRNIDVKNVEELSGFTQLLLERCAQRQLLLELGLVKRIRLQTNVFEVISSVEHGYSPSGELCFRSLTSVGSLTRRVM